MNLATAPRVRAPVVLSGVGPICRHGQSRRALVAALARGCSVEPSGGDGWFDPQPHLGRHGYKYHAKASQMLWAATRAALADAELSEIADKASVGVCIGTNFAVHRTLHGFDE